MVYWLVGLFAAAWFAAAIWLWRKLGNGFVQALIYLPIKLVMRVVDRNLAGNAQADGPLIYAVSHQSHFDA